MQIRIIKKGNRNQLVCHRNDGSVEIADLGPSLPFHDIAHYVVESTLKLQHGFYGNIASGMSVKQLSDKNIIRTLPAESTVAEIITRALQSVVSGAIAREQFTEVIYAEFQQWSISFSFPEKQLAPMLAHYGQLLAKWNALADGRYLELNWG